MNLKVREALLTDLKSLISCQKEMALETENITLDSEVLTEGVFAVLDDPGKAQYYVCESDGSIAGMLMITTEWSDWRNGWVWWIQSVYVKPEFRGRGVYRKMYDHIRKLAIADDSIMGIRLYVDKRNVRAQQVYESLGMTGDHYTTFEWLK